MIKILAKKEVERELASMRKKSIETEKKKSLALNYRNSHQMKEPTICEILDDEDEAEESVSENSSSDSLNLTQTIEENEIEHSDGLSATSMDIFKEKTKRRRSSDIKRDSKLKMRQQALRKRLLNDS